jgi:hypothetical protein
MAAYPTFDVNSLSEFSGRPVGEYANSAYVPSAIAQATLLFKIGTCLGDSFPDDPTQAQLATMAINAMADAIYIVQPFQTVLANPFSSETIGSYSYSKVASAVSGGLPTGITWFDIAISKLSVCDLDGIPTGGGIEVFEWDATFTEGHLEGNARLLSPKDLDMHTSYSSDPSEGFYRGA